MEISNLTVLGDEKSECSSVSSHAAWIDQIKILKGEALEEVLRKVHQEHSLMSSSRRNVAAGYVRACGLSFGGLSDSIQEDPLYQNALKIVIGSCLVNKAVLMNFFLLLKYRIKELTGDIVIFGSYRCGPAIFIAYMARELGIKSTIYALDTFEGLPEADDRIDLHRCGDFRDTSFDILSAFIKALRLDNLVLVKGCFQDSFPFIRSTLQPLSLVHVNAMTYSSVKYAIELALPHLHQQGGYLIVDSAIDPSCLSTLQAVEEMVEKYDLNAEQVWPHLVYRYSSFHQLHS